MNKKMREILTKIQNKTAEAKSFMESGEVEKASTVMDEVESLQAIRSRIYAIVSGTCRSKVNISTMFRVLSREDMVVHSTFVVVGIAYITGHTEEVLCQLHHVVGVARFWAFAVVHIALAIVG